MHGSQGWLQRGPLPEEAAHIEEDVHVVPVQESRPEQPRPLPLLRQSTADGTVAFACVAQEKLWNTMFAESLPLVPASNHAVSRQDSCPSYNGLEERVSCIDHAMTPTICRSTISSKIVYNNDRY